MSAPTHGTPAWFEVATDDPDATAAFYTELFGWQVQPDPGAAAAGVDYRVASTAGSEGPVAGFLGTGGRRPHHAVVSIAVRDVTEVCARVRALGGEVIEQIGPADGMPPNAYLRDPAGNLFGVFTPPTLA